MLSEISQSETNIVESYIRNLKKKKKELQNLVSCFLQGPRWLRPLPRELVRESRPVNLAGTREINWQFLLWHPGALVTELIN